MNIMVWTRSSDTVHKVTDLYTVPHTAHYLGVSKAAAYKRLHQGKMTAVVIDGISFIARSTADEWIKERKERIVSRDG